uniref:K Homology domain-containing protein n=1 Tax=Brassica oleracea var. oleracea TaxID=109376 RepID=A0A0D3BAT1_BRAOL
MVIYGPVRFLGHRTSGCPFGENCHFLHYVPGGYNAVAQLTNMTPPMPQVSRNMQGRFSGRGDSGPGHVSSFGASATAKISVDASLAGAIIGKGGVSSKQIYRQTGAKLTIQDHERDPNLKNIELEGTFEQINEASVMVRELIGRLNSAARRTLLVGLVLKGNRIQGATSRRRYVRDSLKEAVRLVIDVTLHTLRRSGISS